ncbi:RNA polymerase sigma-70 factor (ECF subfamily) [Pseudorhodoplanes sinuspersici]|uniref:RNA polymerase subunit sigma n=2 Tax=Pseudorhodoplanes sinuspersici TaxID=1235591 RepID=A0A1W6ZQN1_9HYPH|nr:RNA polymerase subunit sigma [Pseudorhodoplanes sinuspersici]RKE70685.1 RNA polymerase sigma-70 factor (ECF subfamily) [Pseudorhodoplanes sinuspersici]
MMDTEPDETLVVLVAARDQRALRVLMERHMPRALRVAQRIVSSAADADDIGQEAFMRVWKHAASFDPATARFTTWFYRIVLNLAFDQARKPIHRPIEDASDAHAPGIAAVDRMIEQEQQMMLTNALSLLTGRQRAAIALFHMEGLSGKDAAQAMGLTEKAFESLLTRARMALKQHVEQIGQGRRSYA